MRRLALLAFLVALVAFTGTASGALERTPRTVIENALEKGSARARPLGARGERLRVRVIVTLDDPPLAEAAVARRFGGLGSKQKLNLKSSFSRSYVADLQSAQARAIASLRRAIPAAGVAPVPAARQRVRGERPVRAPSGPARDGLRGAVYPSRMYTMSMNRGPSVIGATQFSGLTGARGDGVKVAVVDDGVDHEHPFSGRQGSRIRPAFRRARWGNVPKVIVARGFAGPGANSAPLDRDRSFHGTFVAGVIAGVKSDVPESRPGFCVESEGGCHPAVNGVEGVAPRAYIGNYRVFNVPAPAPLGGCCSANSPEIVAAFEAAVRDGMDVINFSGGGPQADPMRTSSFRPSRTSPAPASCR